MFFELNRFDRFMLSFWLLGPFILMLGRFAADFWLSSIVLIFLIKSFWNLDWSWVKTDWLKYLYPLFFLFIMSSLFSDETLFSLGESLAWLRFPLFALAVQKLFSNNQKFIDLIIISIVLAIFILLFIGLLEVLFDPKPRLNWPFSKQIPGSYMAKVCIFGIIFFTSYSIKDFKLYNIFSSLLTFIIITYVIFTGERMSLIIVLSSIFLTMVLSKEIKLTLIYFFTYLFLILILMNVFGIQKDRYISHTIIDLFNVEESGYWTVWSSGINAFVQNFWFVIGPAYLAESCDKIPNVIDMEIGCENHPHNYYIQMLAETGIFGPFLLLFFVFGLIKFCWKNSTSLNKNLSNFSFIVPLILFFPISTSGDFFGQTGNIFSWFSISLALLISQKEL